MTLKQEFVTQVENQVADWQAQVKQQQDRIAQANAEARANYEKGLAAMREKTEEANRLLGQVRAAQENAWTDMQAASRGAFEQMQRGWADAMARFR